jgi:hypothetical protein
MFALESSRGAVQTGLERGLDLVTIGEMDAPFPLLLGVEDDIGLLQRSSPQVVAWLRAHHNGLLSLSVNDENMTLKLMLILSCSLLFVSTECWRYAGKISSVPLLTFTTT